MAQKSKNDRVFIDVDIERDVIAALSACCTEFGQMRIMRDAFLANLPDDGLQMLARQEGKPLDVVRRESAEARARLAAAAHTLESLPGGADSKEGASDLLPK
jgi:hypothetical protein